MAAETALGWARTHPCCCDRTESARSAWVGTFGIWDSEYSRTAAMGARWLRYGSDAATLTASVAAMSRSNDEMRAQVSPRAATRCCKVGKNAYSRVRTQRHCAQPPWEEWARAEESTLDPL